MFQCVGWLEVDGDLITAKINNRVMTPKKMGLRKNFAPYFILYVFRGVP